MRDPSNVNLEFLRVFDRAARDLSMTAAARALSVTQPAVSRTIALLEERLAARLFSRSGRSLSLTPEGRALLETTREMFAALEKGRERLEKLRELSEGDIRLALPFRLLHYYLVPHLRRFHRLYPAVRFHIKIENRRTRLLELLEKGDVDFVLDVVHEPPRAASGFASRPLVRCRNFFAASREAYGGLEGRDISLEELNCHPLIVLREGSESRTFLERVFREAGLELNVGSECDTSAAVEEFTAAGLGIGALIRQDGPLDEDLVGDLFEVRLEASLEPGCFVIICREGAAPARAPSFFAELLEESSQSAPGQSI